VKHLKAPGLKVLVTRLERLTWKNTQANLIIVSKVGAYPSVEPSSGWASGLSRKR
jgi:hypothetical protein